MFGRRTTGLLGFLMAVSGGCALTGPPAPEAETWTHAPAELIYPVYMADPRRPTMSLNKVGLSSSEIPGTSENRYGIRIGKRFGILRHAPEGLVGGFQLDGEVGFLGQFDRDNSTDNIGWDGLYGLSVSWLATQVFALRIGFAHDSSHLGDEYIESTGQTRISYTREEILFGASYVLTDAWRTYGEYGHGYEVRNKDLMEPGRLQWGLEYESEPVVWRGRLAPYGALDVSAFEEDEWQTNVTLQVGLLRRADTSHGVWRFGLEYYDGRSSIGEFFRSQEEHLALGFWLDI